MKFGIELVLDQFLLPWMYAETWEQVRAALSWKNLEYYHNQKER
jgi:hypothetical protein